MTGLNMIENFTSTGSKFFAHQEVMSKLRNGIGQPVTTHIMITDVCNHSCAFCSVQARAGDSLLFDDIISYIDILLEYDLKSVILSGGGNPILYKCKKTGKNFNDVVDSLYARGLDIGLITNGMPLKVYDCKGTKLNKNGRPIRTRKSWVTVHPSTLDKLEWIRISMSGLDHIENEVFVPEVDGMKTTLGFSYVAHDIYTEPADPHHGKVSRGLDLISGDLTREPNIYFEERIDDLSNRIAKYIEEHKPRYVRLLPNCLEPELISCRCKQLEKMAQYINFTVNRDVVFVQHKPPKAPKACYLGYIHPVLNTCGGVFPCDSCVLNEAAGHKFSNPWRICHWSEIASIYEQPVRSLIDNPSVRCPGCVFNIQNVILEGVRDGTIDPVVPSEAPTHINFV